MKKVLTAVLLVAATQAMAEAPSYNYVGVEAGIIDLDSDQGTRDIDIGILYGSYALSDHFHVIGGVSKAEAELSFDGDIFDVDQNEYSVGAGFHTVLNPTTTIHVRGSYHHYDLKIDGDVADDLMEDDAMSVSIGIRHNITDTLEVHGSMGTLSYEHEKTTGITAGLDYTFVEGIAATLYTGIDEDDDSFLMVGLQYTF